MWSLHCQDRRDASANRLREMWLAKGFLWKSHCLRKHLIPGHLLQSHSGVSAADNPTVLRSQPQLPGTATSYVLGLSLPEGNCFSAPRSFPKVRGPDWVLSKHHWKYRWVCILGRHSEIHGERMSCLKPSGSIRICFSNVSGPSGCLQMLPESN